jgi:hypothetical protein
VYTSVYTAMDRILRMAGEVVKPAEISGPELDRKREKEWRSWWKKQWGHERAFT